MVSEFAFELMSTQKTYDILLDLIIDGPHKEESKSNEVLPPKVLDIKFAALTVLVNLAQGEDVVKFIMTERCEKIITFFCEQIPINL